MEKKKMEGKKEERKGDGKEQKDKAEEGEDDGEKEEGENQEEGVDEDAKTEELTLTHTDLSRSRKNKTEEEVGKYNSQGARGTYQAMI